MNWFRQNRWLGIFVTVLAVATLFAVYVLLRAKGAFEEASARFNNAAAERNRLEHRAGADGSGRESVDVEGPFQTFQNVRTLSFYILAGCWCSQRSVSVLFHGFSGCGRPICAKSC